MEPSVCCVATTWTGGLCRCDSATGRRPQTPKGAGLPMTTLYLRHPAALDHQTPLGHPERADRIRAIERALEEERFSRARPRAGAAWPRRRLTARVHPAPYVASIREAAPREGMVRIDADTVMSPGTFEAALRARRSRGPGRRRGDGGPRPQRLRAPCARPAITPSARRAMGFCFFNNVAIAARHAQAAHGAERVAIFDFDVHHGNGTQDIFWATAACSTPRRTRCRSIPAPARARSGASRHRRQRAAAGRRRRRGVPRGGRGGVLPRIEAFSARPRHRLGRLRRPLARSARQPRA